jgi:hypothetical protein
VKSRKLSPLASTLVGVLVAGLVAAAGWFLLVSPQRSRAADLDVEIAAVEQQISEARRAQLEAKDVGPIHVADLFRLTKAMPTDSDISGVLLELSRIAADTGITFNSISPGAPALYGTFRAQPITLTFEGDFYSLSDFLYRLRTLVIVERGRLIATGRLFSIDTFTFGEGEGGFPSISAGLTVSAYLYGEGPVAGAAPAPTTTPTDTAGTGTTATTDTTATTTETTPTDTSAPSATGAP